MVGYRLGVLGLQLLMCLGGNYGSSWWWKKYKRFGGRLMKYTTLKE